VPCGSTWAIDHVETLGSRGCIYQTIAFGSTISTRWLTTTHGLLTGRRRWVERDMHWRSAMCCSSPCRARHGPA